MEQLFERLGKGDYEAMLFDVHQRTDAVPSLSGAGTRARRSTAATSAVQRSTRRSTPSAMLDPMTDYRAAVAGLNADFHRTIRRPSSSPGRNAHARSAGASRSRRNPGAISWVRCGFGSPLPITGKPAATRRMKLRIRHIATRFALLARRGGRRAAARLRLRLPALAPARHPRLDRHRQLERRHARRRGNPPLRRQQRGAAESARRPTCRTPASSSRQQDRILKNYVLQFREFREITLFDEAGAPSSPRAASASRAIVDPQEHAAGRRRRRRCRRSASTKTCCRRRCSPSTSRA